MEEAEAEADMPVYNSVSLETCEEKNGEREKNDKLEARNGGGCAGEWCEGQNSTSFKQLTFLSNF